MRAVERIALACLLGSTLLLCGCWQELDTRYGFRRPTGSVNGTEVFASLFERAGHKVSGWSRLSPRLRTKADCIVWFAASEPGPGQKTRRWFEDWLEEDSGRTLIYVGRDYDAAPDYWRQIRDGTSGDDFRRLSRYLAEAQNEDEQPWSALEDHEDVEWFQIDRTQSAKTLSPMEGSSRWLAQVDGTKVEPKVHTRFVPPDDAEVLLHQGEDVLVSREAFGESQLIVVTNGSFLLNLPLVNPEHRKLAAALVNEIGPPAKRVVFLESRSGEPALLDEEPKTAQPSHFRYFGLEPLNFILLHLAFVGILFLCARAPLFGIPREITSESKGDFGQHIDAVGDLLSKTHAAKYAEAKIAEYETLTHSDTASQQRG